MEYDRDYFRCQSSFLVCGPHDDIDHMLPNNFDELSLSERKELSLRYHLIYQLRRYDNKENLTILSDDELKQLLAQTNLLKKLQDLKGRGVPIPDPEELSAEEQRVLHDTLINTIDYKYLCPYLSEYDGARQKLEAGDPSLYGDDFKLDFIENLKFTEIIPKKITFNRIAMITEDEWKKLANKQRENLPSSFGNLNQCGNFYDNLELIIIRFMRHYAIKLGYESFEHEELNDIYRTIMRYTLLHMRAIQVRKSLTTYNLDMDLIKEYRSYLEEQSISGSEISCTIL